MEGFGPRRPTELSGGQRQRVALARALAAQPKVLLLDEPFGALDAQVRQELRQWLRRLHHSVGVTTILVTHDQEEAFEVADRVVLLNRGRVEQVGAPLEVFENPANSFVMDFLGRVNIFHGRVEAGRVFLGGLEVPCPDYLHDESRAAAVYVRPHELDIEGEPNGVPSLPARVLHINPAGPVARVHLAAQAIVTFHPVGTDPAKLRPSAQTDAEGYFRLTTYENGDGAPEGQYAVTVTWFRSSTSKPTEGDESMRNLLPLRYANPARSKLEATVSAGDNDLAPFRVRAQ